MSDRDDLFLDALENDEDVAWRLAEAAARPAPPRLREAIVGPRRRARLRPFGLAWPPPGASLRAALGALVLITLAGTIVATEGQLQGARAQSADYERALAALATGGRVVALDPSPSAGGRGSLVLSTSGQAYLVLALPAPPAGRAYEAWIIRDGSAVPAGLAPAREGVVVVALSASPRPGDTAAVTLELAAGAQRPTTDPLLAGKL